MVKSMTSPYTLAQPQRGAVLIISLMLLATLTLIGITAARSTRLQTAMATNAKEASIAFEAAEAAVRDAEQFIENVVVIDQVFDDGDNDGMLGTGDGEPNYHDDATWSGAGSLAYGSGGAAVLPDVATQPRYIIKYLGSVSSGSGGIEPCGYPCPSASVSLFRITVRGTGRTDAAQTIIQTEFGRI